MRHAETRRYIFGISNKAPRFGFICKHKQKFIDMLLYKLRLV